MKAEDVTKTELKKVVAELNEQLGLEPPILGNLKKEALEKAIGEAATLIDVENDEFSDEVWEIMEAMGVVVRGKIEQEIEEEEVVTDEETAEAVEEAVADTLVEDFKACKKLASYKSLVGEWECFDSIDVDQFTGLQGTRELKAAMIACMPEDVVALLETADKKKSPNASGKPRVSRKKGPGVIATIANCIENSGEEGITKEGILVVLKEAFPEREEASMKKTLNVQCPTRITKEKFKVGVKDGRYFKEA